MKPGDVLVFKRYSDWKMKKLFKMNFPLDERYPEQMKKLRNRLIHRRQNVGKIYIVEQWRFGKIIKRWGSGIPIDYWNEDPQLFWDDLEFIVRITKRN